jgi:hypothetical protein
MRLMSQWAPDTRVRLLVYGKSKVGKTFGALTFPRPCVLDFDSGIATARNPEFVRRYGTKEIIYEQFTEGEKDKRGIVVQHGAFDSACSFFDLMMRPDNIEKFDTWVVDSGTSLSEAALNKAIVLLGDKAFSGAKSATHEQARKFGLVVPKLQDYGSERSMVEQFVDMVLDTKKHLVFICHEKEMTNPEGITTAITPLLTGKGVEAVALRFDEVYNLKATGNALTRKRELVTESDGIRMAGSRYGLANGTEFTWDAIISALTAARQPKKEEK